MLKFFFKTIDYILSIILIGFIVFWSILGMHYLIYGTLKQTTHDLRSEYHLPDNVSNIHLVGNDAITYEFKNDNMTYLILHVEGPNGGEMVKLDSWQTSVKKK